MIEGKSILAIILARGGSKGIEKKNIKLLKGKPLIAYTIEEAKKSRFIDRVILSTEDEEIAKVGKQLGVEVPFLRPKELATDTSTSEEGMLHAIQWLRDNESFESEYVLLLQPTSPLRIVDDIDEAIKKIVVESGDSLVGLCKADKHPLWMRKIVDGQVVPFISLDQEYTRRQDLPDVYNINGAIYIIKTELFEETRSRWAGKLIPFIMPKERSIDIDDMIDWSLTEVILDRL